MGRASSAEWGALAPPRMIVGMNPVLGVVWHFWIAVFLAIPTILLVIGIGVMYLRKVEMPRYPRD